LAILSEIAARRDALALSPATPAFREEEIVMGTPFNWIEHRLDTVIGALP
jgi:hypothetical protein